MIGIDRQIGPDGGVYPLGHGVALPDGQVRRDVDVLDPIQRDHV